MFSPNLGKSLGILRYVVNFSHNPLFNNFLKISIVGFPDLVKNKDHQSYILIWEHQLEESDLTFSCKTCVRLGSCGLPSVLRIRRMFFRIAFPSGGGLWLPPKLYNWTRFSLELLFLNRRNYPACPLLFSSTAYILQT